MPSCAKALALRDSSALPSRSVMKRLDLVTIWFPSYPAVVMRDLRKGTSSICTLMPGFLVSVPLLQQGRALPSPNRIAGRHHTDEGESREQNLEPDLRNENRRNGEPYRERAAHFCEPVPHKRAEKLGKSSLTHPHRPLSRCHGRSNRRKRKPQPSRIHMSSMSLRLKVLYINLFSPASN